MDRKHATTLVMEAKQKLGVSWKDLAEAVGQSPVWTTAALLGQMSMSAAEAKAAGALLKLDDEAIAALQTVPTRGCLEQQAVPTDPLIYRFYEIVQVYGTTLKSLIEEEFGDGIMSAIDFTMDIKRIPDPKGDRVQVTLNGKFLPYKRY